jgi:hypothetical protein
MPARRLFGVWIVSAGTVFLSSAAGAAAADRFASPSGSGTACTQVAPCDIVTAVNKAADKDDVTIEPGTYGPLSTFLYDEGRTLTIHGEEGAPRPVIESSAGIGIALGGPKSSVSDLEIDVSSSNSAGLYLFAPGNSVDRVLSHALGVESKACQVIGAYGEQRVRRRQPQIGRARPVFRQRLARDTAQRHSGGAWRVRDGR